MSTEQMLKALLAICLQEPYRLSVGTLQSSVMLMIIQK